MVRALHAEQFVDRFAGLQPQRHVAPHFDHFGIEQAAPEAGFAHQVIAFVGVHVDGRNPVDGDVGGVDGPVEGVPQRFDLAVGLRKAEIVEVGVEPVVVEGVVREEVLRQPEVVVENASVGGVRIARALPLADRTDAYRLVNGVDGAFGVRFGGVVILVRHVRQGHFVEKPAAGCEPQRQEENRMNESVFHVRNHYWSVA